MKSRFPLLCVLVAGLTIAACTNPAAPDPSGPGSDQPIDKTPDPDPTPEPEPPDPGPQLGQATFVINFDTETPGYIAGMLNGTGIDHPPQPGQLDADAWQVLGMSDGDQEFGSPGLGGDFTRGISPGGVSSGGLYAFEVEETNVALGVQPTSSDFQPGSISLRANPPAGVTAADVEFGLWTLNDQGRSTEWTVEWSVDGAEWVEPGPKPVTPETADVSPAWTYQQFQFSLAESEIAGASLFLIRWSAADGAGSGSRDESALDDISVAFTHIVGQ